MKFLNMVVFKKLMVLSSSLSTKKKRRKGGRKTDRKKEREVVSTWGLVGAVDMKLICAKIGKEVWSADWKDVVWGLRRRKLSNVTVRPERLAGGDVINQEKELKKRCRPMS